MARLQPAASAEPGRWLLRSDVDWSTLVRHGPPGFAVYCRVPFGAGSRDAGEEGEEPALRAVLAALALHTGTPDQAYAAVWEGWTGAMAAPRAPRLDLPHRPMLLFTGPVDLMRDAPALGWASPPPTYQEPHLVWPADRAWCVACEVDEEIAFTVGCDADAARALELRLPDAVRRVAYGAPEPVYREPV